MNDWDWSDLFGAFFDRLDMDDEKKEEFVEDFYNMNQDERNIMIEVMAEVIVGDMEYEDGFEEGFQLFLELWEDMVVGSFKECEEDEFPCFIPDNGYVLN